jgi:GNAT superfamily N-acetyltransferase
MSYRFGMITEPGIAIRPARSDADLEAWNRVRRIVVPNESVPTIDALRAIENPDRLMLLAESSNEVIGSGVADRSQTTGGFVAPRVLPEQRRRGVGSSLLRALLDHLVERGFESVGAHPEDDGSYTFAVRHGFEEVDRQIEQVRMLTPDEPPAPPFEGVEFWTVAQRPELLQRSFALAQQGYADMVLKIGPAVVPIDEWLREEATLPAGTFVALEHGMIVGYAGLNAWTDDDSRAENGLTVVDRRWRGRGLATALKRRQLAWAAANGIREVVTWTQIGNEAMQRVNESLGYTLRGVSRTMRRDLP